MLKRSKKSVLYFFGIFTPFFIFFLFASYIFLKGEKKYEKYQGLAKSTEIEYIVQYLEKVFPPLSLEVYPYVRADRVQLGEESKAVLYVRNIGEKLARFYVELKTKPVNFSKLEVRFDTKRVYSLEKGEKVKLFFPYILKKGYQDSKDGTLDMYFIFSDKE